jgi:hypothetical protein
VYAFGRSKAPYCIDCALSAFGVRAAGSNEADVPVAEAAGPDAPV